MTTNVEMGRLSRRCRPATGATERREFQSVGSDGRTLVALDREEMAWMRLFWDRRDASREAAPRAAA